jgi:hypothetical protein
MKTLKFEKDNNVLDHLSGYTFIWKISAPKGQAVPKMIAQNLRQ